MDIEFRDENGGGEIRDSTTAMQISQEAAKVNRDRLLRAALSQRVHTRLNVHVNELEGHRAELGLVAAISKPLQISQRAGTSARASYLTETAQIQHPCVVSREQFTVKDFWFTPRRRDWRPFPVDQSQQPVERRSIAMTLTPRDLFRMRTVATALHPSDIS